MLATLGLPVRAPAVDVDAVLGAMAHDKKARDGRVPFVLSPRLGAVPRRPRRPPRRRPRRPSHESGRGRTLSGGASGARRRRDPPARGAAGARSRFPGLRAAGRSLPQGRADARGRGHLPRRACALAALHDGSLDPRQDAAGRGPARGGPGRDLGNSPDEPEGRTMSPSGCRDPPPGGPPRRRGASTWRRRSALDPRDRESTALLSLLRAARRGPGEAPGWRRVLRDETFITLTFGACVWSRGWPRRRPWCLTVSSERIPTIQRRSAQLEAALRARSRRRG